MKHYLKRKRDHRNYVLKNALLNFPPRMILGVEMEPDWGAFQTDRLWPLPEPVRGGDTPA